MESLLPVRMILRGVFLTGLCVLAAGCMAVPFARPPGVAAETVVYSRPGWPQAMEAEIYPPSGKSIPRSAPGVLLLHGAGLKGGAGRWQMNAIAGKLAKRGYWVMNASYRAMPQYPYPVPEEDAREALRWMRENAARYGIDRRRIAVFGYSAGGYLASLTALKDEARQDRVRAIVAGGAPSDLVFYAGGDFVRNYLGGRREEVPERFYDSAPVHYVKRGSPPIFMWHGTRDALVRPEHPLRMQQAYARAGARSTIRWLPGRGHVGAFLFSGAAVEEAIDFLDREMK